MKDSKSLQSYDFSSYYNVGEIGHHCSRHDKNAIDWFKWENHLLLGGGGDSGEVSHWIYTQNEHCLFNF